MTVRQLVSWSLPGLVMAGPLALLLERWQVAPPWPVWIAAAVTLGFVLHQMVRCAFEARGNGFRNPHRAALAVIIERGNLTRHPYRGDIAYQVYEVVFYQRAEWQALRDHAHRCWDYTFLCWSMGLAGMMGAIISATALVSAPGFSLLYVCGYPPGALILWYKGQQIRAALDVFDRGIVLAHWSAYEEVLRSLLTRGERRHSADSSASTSNPIASII